MKTPSRLVEKPASLTAPPALHRVRVRILPREVVKPGPTRRPLLQPASCLHRPARPPSRALVFFLLFSCLVAFEQCLVKSAQFHPLGVFKLKSVAGLLAAFMYI